MVERLTLDGKRVTGLVAAPARRPRARVTARARGDPGGRRHRLAADPAALGHRSRRGAAAARHRGAARAAGVGENLQDHLQIRCAYKVAGVKTLNERFQSLVQRAGFAAQYALTRRGPMTMAPSQLGAFVKSDPEPRHAQPRVPRPAAHACPSSASRSIRSRPSPPASPTSARPAAAGCASPRPTRRRIPRSGPTTSPPPRTGTWRPTPCASRATSSPCRRWRNIAREEFRPGLEFQSDEELAQGRRRHRHHHLPPGRHLQDGQRRDAPWSTPACGARPRRACASPTPPSCPPSPPATPTRRR